MQYGFNPGELVATRVEKASDCPEIYVIVRKFMLEVSGNSRYLPQFVRGRGGRIRTGDLMVPNHAR
jgi:hypothetical protein